MNTQTHRRDWTPEQLEILVQEVAARRTAREIQHDHFPTVSLASVRQQVSIIHEEITGGTRTEKPPSPTNTDRRRVIQSRTLPEDFNENDVRRMERVARAQLSRNRRELGAL